MRAENYASVEFLKDFWNVDKNGIELIDAKLENKYKYWWHCSDYDHSFKKDIRFMQRDQECLVCKGRQFLKGFNDFETRGQKYMHEWDYEKNTVEPDEVLFSSKTLIYWKCSLNHSWETNTQDKIRNRGGCPYYSNSRLLKGYNDLLTRNPELAIEWDPRNEVMFDEVIYCSTNEYKWICQKDDRHKWKEKLFNRTNGARMWNCPYCAGKRVMSGVNDLATTHPEWLKEWDYEKNKETNLDLAKLTYGSNKKAWWLCKKFKHSWKVAITERTKYGCSICANKTVLKGYNDFASQAPQKFLDEWDYNKNNIKPDEITFKSEKEIWWICPDHQHSYDMNLDRRTVQNQKCPFCKNIRILAGFNDLASLYPEIAKEWHPTKNGDLTPDKVSAGSGYKVWWKCDNEKHDSWEAKIVERTSSKSGCRWCAIAGSSKMEKDLRDEIKKIYKSDLIVNSKSVIYPYELDIYLPDLKFAVEFNGTYWHSDDVIKKNHNMSANEYHNMKSEMCANIGIKLFHVFEEDWLNDQENILLSIEQKLMKLMIVK